MFRLTRFNHPLSVGQLRVRPGDLLMADQDSCVKVPRESAAEVLRLALQVRTDEEAIFAAYRAPDFSVAQMRRQRGS